MVRKPTMMRTAKAEGVVEVCTNMVVPSANPMGTLQPGSTVTRAIPLCHALAVFPNHFGEQNIGFVFGCLLDTHVVTVRVAVTLFSIGDRFRLSQSKSSYRST